MKSSLRRRALWSLSALIGSSLFATGLAAADRFWIGTTTDIWSDPAAWSSTSDGLTPAAAPTSADIARFNATGAVVGFANIKLNGDQTVLGLATNSANGFTPTVSTTLVGGDANHTLTLGTSGINHMGGGLTIGSTTAGQRVAISLLDSQTWTSSTGGTGAVAIIALNEVSLANAGAQTLTLTGQNTGSRIDGVISDGAGVLSLVKNGTGATPATSVWTLTGANTFSGGVTLNTGILRAGNASAYGSGTITINGGSLDAVSAGITLSTNNAQIWNGNFAFTGTGNLNVGTGAVTMNSPRTVTTTANTLTVGGVISGTGSLNALDVVKAGAGNLNLSNTSLITLRSGGQTVTSNAGLLTIAAELDNGGNLLTVAGAGNTSLTGSISGTAGVTKSDAGILILGGANTFGGGLTINAGTVRAGSATAFGTGTLTVNGGALDAAAAGFTLSTNNTQSWNSDFAFTGTGALNLGTGAVTLAATRTITTTASTLTVGGVISGAGGIVKAGAGTLALTGNNAYTGKIQINAGTLAISNDLNLGAVPSSFVADQITLNGGTLQIGAGIALDANRGIALTANSALTLTHTSGNASTGIISGNFQLTVNPTGTGGNYTPTAQNTYSGGTILNAGAGVVIPISDSIGSPGAVTSGPFGTGPVTFNGASFRFTASGGPIHTLANDIIFAANTTFTTATGVFPTIFSGPISITGNRTITQGSAASFTFSNVVSDGGGNFNFTKAGTGQLILNGLNTYGGATAVSAGTLTISNIANGNSPSALGQSGSAAANLLLGNGSTLQYNGTGHTSDRGFTINGTAAGHAAILDASGNGALVLNNTASPAYGTVDQTRTLTLTGTSLDANTLAAAIANNGTGAVSLTKTGTGRWILIGSPTFSGATTISGGTLQYRTPSSASAASAISIGASGILGINIDGSGEFTSTGSGAGTLAGVLTGTLGGGITFAAGSSIGLDTSNAPGDVTYSPVITNSTGNTLAMGIAKLGTGTLVLSGANTYTGPTTINGGTLRVGVATVAGVSGALGINSAVTLANNANTTLDLAGFNTQIATLSGGGTNGGNVSLGAATLTVTSGTYAGSISGLGGLTKIGGSTLNLTGSNNYDGVTAITGTGTLIANHANALGSTTGNTTVASGSSLAIGSGVTVTGETVVIEGNGVGNNGALTTVTGATLPATWDGPIILNGTSARIGAQSGTTLVVKGAISNGTGSSLFINTASSGGFVEIASPAGSNTYTGSTNIVRSTLRLGADNALPTTTILDVHQAGTTDAALFDLNGFNQTVAGLRRTDTTGPGTVTNTSTTPKTLTINNTSNFTYSGVIAGANTALAKTGTGTQTLSGTNTYGGTTTVNAGTLSVTGSLANNSSANVLMAAPDDTLTGNPVLTRSVPATANAFAGFGSKVTAASIESPLLTNTALQTTADILLSNTNADVDTLSMQWRQRSVAEASPSNPNAVLSDVISITGMDNGADIFVLQMSYTDAALGSLNETSIATSGELRLGWNDAGTWKTATAGNTIPGSTFAGITSWADFVTANSVTSANLNTFLGSYGVDPSGAGGVVWAVLDHNSEFAVIPEPSTLVLGGLALLGFAGVGLRRRRRLANQG